MWSTRYATFRVMRTWSPSSQNWPAWILIYAMLACKFQPLPHHVSSNHYWGRDQNGCLPSCPRNAGGCASLSVVKMLLRPFICTTNTRSITAPQTIESDIDKRFVRFIYVSRLKLSLVWFKVRLESVEYGGSWFQAFLHVFKSNK